MSEKSSHWWPEDTITPQPDALEVILQYRDLLNQPLDPNETREDAQIRAGNYLDEEKERRHLTDMQLAVAFDALSHRSARGE